MRIFKIISLCFFMLAAMPLHVYAGSNKEALAKAQFMLRQMNAELNQLRASKQKLLAEKVEVEKDYARLQKKHDKLSHKSEKTKANMTGKYAELKQKYKDELSEHRKTLKQLSNAINENKRIVGIAGKQMNKIEVCANNNKKLFDINQRLLVRFEDKGVWDSLTQAEPFSRLSQVDIENLVDDYQYDMDNLRVKSDL